MPSSNAGMQLQYQVCPIILTGGSAANVSGGAMPIITLFSGFVTSGADLDDAFGAFNVLPGGTLISQQVAKYPFANQMVAANAAIREPLSLSVIMDAPMRGPNAWITKRTILTALKGALDNHNNLGGTYTVYTPAYMYENLIMTAMTDNSRGNNSLPQNAWRFDFEKPLVTVADLQGAQNQLATKMTNGVPSPGNITGPQPGSTAAQPQLSQPQNKLILAGLTSSSPTALGTAQNFVNFPALPNQAQFPFSGIA